MINTGAAYAALYYACLGLSCWGASYLLQFAIDGFNAQRERDKKQGEDLPDGIRVVGGYIEGRDAYNHCNDVQYVEGMIFRFFYHDMDCFTKPTKI